MKVVSKKTTKQDQKLASQSLHQLRHISSSKRRETQKGVQITLEDSGEQLTIPESAFLILVEVLSSMSEGKSITLLPAETEISTQQAAGILNISRPHLVKLLESGLIPHKKVGSHRRIELRDLVLYEEILKKMRESQLEFLSQQAQELKLGYE